jgi:CheY-like chemotaxis protein
MGGLLAREKCNLAFASGGEEALAKVEETSPDVILLDIMMPDIDGFEVCRRLKAHPKWRHIPIILLLDHPQM